jgi:hypothetical protein
VAIATIGHRAANPIADKHFAAAKTAIDANLATAAAAEQRELRTVWDRITGADLRVPDRRFHNYVRVAESGLAAHIPRTGCVGIICHCDRTTSTAWACTRALVGRIIRAGIDFHAPR